MKNINIKIKEYIYTGTGVVKDKEGNFKIVELEPLTVCEKMSKKDIREHFEKYTLNEDETEFKILEIKPVEIKINDYEVKIQNLIEIANIKSENVES